MNVYVEESKYLFSIVQRLVLENFDEIWNVRVIYSDDPSCAKVKISHPQWSSGQRQKSTCSQTLSYVWEKSFNQQKEWKDGKDSRWNFRQKFLEKKKKRNRWRADWVRVESFRRTYSIGIASEDSGVLWRAEILTLNNVEIELPSCLCSTTSIGIKRTVNGNVFKIPKKSEIMRRDSCEDIGRSLDLEVKRSGVFHIYQSLKGHGSPWQPKCYNDSWRQDTQFFKVPVLWIVTSLKERKTKTPFISQQNLRVWNSYSESFTARISSVSTEQCRVGLDSQVLQELSLFRESSSKLKNTLTRKRRRVWTQKK